MIGMIFMSLSGLGRTIFVLILAYPTTFFKMDDFSDFDKGLKFSNFELSLLNG